MGQPTSPSPALLLLAAFSRHPPALDWARAKAAAAWGTVAHASERFDFTETDYYASAMGTGLKKEFCTFAAPFDPGRLAEIKLQSNAWEAEYAALAPGAETRPLNLDPGYLTLAKLVLASTKDHAHRIYLREGIYAEVTLYWSQRRWQSREWTYADYRRDDVQRFLTQCRQWLHEQRLQGVWP